LRAKEETQRDTYCSLCVTQEQQNENSIESRGKLKRGIKERIKERRRREREE
jgi:hypothetical protein